MNHSLTILLNLPILRFGLFAFLMSVVYGCNIDNPSGNLSSIPTEEDSVIPNSVWISDAEYYVDNYEKKDSTYSLYADLNSPDAREIKMIFGPLKYLQSVEILGEANLSHILYFENRKVIFSHHIDSIAGIEWLVAYANEKPYAAATSKNNGEWKAIHPEDIPLNRQIILYSVKQAKKFQEKEIQHSYAYRFMNNPETIDGKFDDDLSLMYTMNVRKGESLHLKLESENKTIYFTVSPNNGSDMEQREWKEVAGFTGDINITVSLVDSRQAHNFSLKAEGVTPQNQVFSQVQ